MGLPAESNGVPQGLMEFGVSQPTSVGVPLRASQGHGRAIGAPARRDQDGDVWVPIEAKSDPAGEDLQLLLDDVNRLGGRATPGVHLGGGSCMRLLLAHGHGKFVGSAELHWLSGALVEPAMGRTFPRATGTRPWARGADPLPADRIIPFRDTVNLADPYRLLSPLSSARFEISVNKRASEWNDALLRNWDPRGRVGREPHGRDHRQRQVLHQAGPAPSARAGQPGQDPHPPAGLEWTQLSMSQKDADWISSRKVSA